MSRSLTDPATVREQYADSDNLNARVRLHLDHSVNPKDFVEWLFDQVALTEDAVVLEAGCGPGWLWRRTQGRVPASWQLTLTDVSAGMVGEAQAHLAQCGLEGDVCVADVQRLPFPDAHFDIVFANHMLYHVQDLPAALSQLRRVLKPGGVLYAATNGERHLGEIDDLLRSARQGLRWRFSKLSFALDESDQDLAPHFSHVEKRIYEDELRITRTADLIDFIASAITLDDELRHDLETVIQRRIDDVGHFYVGKHVGLLIARA